MKNKAIICGGSNPSTPQNKCYEHQGTNWITRVSSLLYPRSEVAYTKINQDQFWISGEKRGAFYSDERSLTHCFIFTGGWGGNNYLSTTEIYDATTDRFSLGPSLPRARGDHCLVQVSEFAFQGQGLATQRMVYLLIQ